MASLLNRCGYFVNDSVRIPMSDADYASVKLYNGYSDSLLTFASVCLVISMIIGIPGNLITIVALANFKKMRNATAIFIMNMSCADMILLCLDPPLVISTYWYRFWAHGRILCEQYALAKCVLISASVFTTVAITINRYILIIHPSLYRKIYQKRNLVMMLAAIWTTPLLILMPTYLGKWGCFDLDLDDGPCSVVPDLNKRSSKMSLFIAVLGLPCILIISCYTRILLVVRKSAKKSQNTETTKSTEVTITHDFSSMIARFPTVTSENEEEEREFIPLKVIANLKSEHSKGSILETPGGSNNTADKKMLTHSEPPRIRRRSRILKRSMTFFKFSLPTRKDKRLGTMILAIMTSFCLCYLPTAITAVIRRMAPYPELNIAANVLICFSCCINPVIYVVMSNEYQKAYKNLFKCRFYICKTLIDFCGLSRRTLLIKS